MLYIKQACAIIKEFEGFSAKVYICAAGYKTIGYGTKITKDSEGLEEISEDFAFYMLKEAVEKIGKFVEKVVLPTKLNDSQIAALVSFIYNVGIVAFKNSTMLKLIKVGKLKEAGDEFDRWDHVKGEKVKGLTIRRAKEKQLFIGGVK